MKTITTTINPLYKPRLSWVSFHSTQFRKFRLVHPIGSGHFGTALLYSAYKNKNQTRGGFFSGLCNRNAPFHWARGMSEHLNRNFLLNCTALVLPYFARQRARTPPPYSLCIDANFFSMRRGEGPSLQATALTIVKKGIKGFWKKRYYQTSQRLCMLCHQLRRLVKIESNTHTKPLLNASGDVFLLIDAH